ncbi:MAG TPA: RidA family protein [Bryobacteraceae bacterium]|nr:RidA family protein [Bryobacteraceae bacterium]
MSKRVSIEVPGLKHDNPIPAACRIGPFLVSSVISPKDAGGKVPESLDAQCAQVFDNLKALLAAAGASPEQVIKLTVWLKDRALRPHVNKFWLELFPDPHSRPARHTFSAPDLPDPQMVQMEVMAVLAD